MKHNLQENALRLDEDWAGNNAPFTCPCCGKVFVVSGFMHPEGRRCPNNSCGKSFAYVKVDKKQGIRVAYIEVD